MVDTSIFPASKAATPLRDHLSRREIFDRYRQTKGAAERTHWQIIYLKNQGKTVNDIINITGYDEEWIRDIVLRYNREGPDAFIEDEDLPSEIKAEYLRKSNELNTARQAQQEMLAARIPTHPELEIDAFLKTATEVSGDYYDFSLCEEGKLTIAIGDATGHGTTAGMMVIATKALFKALADESNLRNLVRRMSETLKSLNLRNTYMHLALARYNKGVLRLIVAGMPPVLVYRAATKTIEDIVLKGMPLGSFTEFPYEEFTIPLESGDTVLFMSDGFLELLSPCGDMLQLDRIRRIFAEAGNRSPSEVIVHLRKAGLAWRAERALNDDVTLLVLKRRPNQRTENPAATATESETS
jgi:sigma-B regulation protein RsbU (phosphoserine phosphatase)